MAFPRTCVAVAEMVLAELAGFITLRLEKLGDRHVAWLESFRRAGQADLEHAGPDADLTRDEGGAPCGAALLASLAEAYRRCQLDLCASGKLRAGRVIRARHGWPATGASSILRTLTEENRENLRRVIDDAGSRATADAPLA
jgi:hypothetical protein